MADTKISDLTAQTAATIANDDEFVIVDTDAGATERLTASQLIAYVTRKLVFDIETIAATDASYTPSNTLQVIVLDDAGDDTDIALTFAAAIATGSVVVIHAADGGATGHTVTLSGQTFDGTNTIATFNAADDRIAFVAMSASRVLILYNNSVTLST